jgi:hypothetical protein
MRWKGNIKSLLLNEILFVSLHVGKKLKIILELMSRRGNGIFPKIISIPKFIHCLLLVANRLFLLDLETRMEEIKEKKLSNLP